VKRRFGRLTPEFFEEPANKSLKSPAKPVLASKGKSEPDGKQGTQNEWGHGNVLHRKKTERGAVLAARPGRRNKAG